MIICAKGGKLSPKFNCFIKHMPKMSGYPNKSVFMLQIKKGMKKGGGLRSQNCFFLGTLTFLAYSCLVKTHILSFITPPLFARF